jgi:outer membrane protein assembly factor BamB
MGWGLHLFFLRPLEKYPFVVAFGGGKSLTAFDFDTGKRLWTKAKTEVDAIRAHDSKPAYRDLELDANGKTIWAACICDKVDGEEAKALVC